jgi:hypothetical protein
MENQLPLAPVTPTAAASTKGVEIIAGTDANLRPKAPVEPPIKESEASKKYTLQFGENDKEEVDEQTLLKYAQKARGADKAFQSAAAQRKETENILSLLKENPAKVVLNKALGHDPKSVIGGLIKQAIEDGYDVKEIKALVADQMYEWIQEENLDPKEKENRDLKKKLESFESQKKQAEEAQKKEVFEKMTQEAYQKFDTDITEVLKTSGLPKSSYTVKRMAYYMDQAYKLKQEYAAQGTEMRDPKASDVVDYVRKDYEDSLKEMYGQADVETLMKLLGEENVAKIRKHDVEQFKKKQPVSDAPKRSESPMKRSAPEPRQPKGKNWLKQREEEIRQLERGL